MPVIVGRDGKKVWLQLGMIFNGHWLETAEQEKAANEFETAVVRHAGKLRQDLLKIKRPMLPVRRLDPDFIGMEEAHRVGLMHISTVLTEDMIRKAAELLMRSDNF